jgi:hypothetical protein
MATQKPAGRVTDILYSVGVRRIYGVVRDRDHRVFAHTWRYQTGSTRAMRVPYKAIGLSSHTRTREMGGRRAALCGNTVADTRTP